VKQLIVNADDFGFTRDVNAGIVECHRNGILTATTLMANGDAFEDAVRLAKENPTLDIGVHLVLVGGPGQPPSLPAFMVQLARSRRNLAAEMRLQVQTILDAGLRPSHLDTHKHTHLAPPVLRAVIQTSREFDIPWVRRPADFTMPAHSSPFFKKLVNKAVQFAANRFDNALHRGGCRFTDHFTGFEVTGRLGTPELLSILRHLPDGITELMCHPGYLREELGSAPTRLKESRVKELEALTSPEARAILSETGVQLTTYRDL
jgi:chitin disaccharide deacetylase